MNDKPFLLVFIYHRNEILKRNFYDYVPFSTSALTCRQIALLDCPGHMDLQHGWVTIISALLSLLHPTGNRYFHRRLNVNIYNYPNQMLIIKAIFHEVLFDLLYVKITNSKQRERVLLVLVFSAIMV